MPTTRPNFLIFCLDQIGASAFPFYGNGDVCTPNLEQLAARSAVCQRAYCQNPVCMPSRATLLTGLTPRQHGCVTNGVPLASQVPTLTDRLRQEGYRTHAVGKLHLQPGLDANNREPLPDFSWEDAVRWRTGEIQHLPEGYYGFDSSDYVNGHVSGCYGDYVNEIEESHPGTIALYQKKTGLPCPGNAISWRTEVPADHHYNRWIADKTSAFIQSAGQDTDPFFVWCSFPDPHGPWAAAKEYADRFDPGTLTLCSTWHETEDPVPRLAAEREKLPAFLKVSDQATLAEVTAQTYAMMEHIDENIGRVLDTLEASGQAKDTVIVFLSDHGEYLGAHGLLGKTPWPYEELLRIPMLWSLPAHRKGELSTGELTEPVSTVDFAPTILDLAGIEANTLFNKGNAQGDYRLPGISLRPQIEGNTESHGRAVLCEFDNGMKPGALMRTRTIITRRWKLCIIDGEVDGILFDLENDPHERRNLWNEADKQTEKAGLIERLFRETLTSDRIALPRWIGA